MDETIVTTVEQRLAATHMLSDLIRGACDSSDRPSAEALATLATDAATAMVAGLKIINASN